MRYFTHPYRSTFMFLGDLGDLCGCFVAWLHARILLLSMPMRMYVPTKFIVASVRMLMRRIDRMNMIVSMLGVCHDGRRGITSVAASHR